MTLISAFQLLSGPVLYCVLKCYVTCSLYEINYCLNKHQDSDMYKFSTFDHACPQNPVTSFINKL